jgi:transaldolase
MSNLHPIAALGQSIWMDELSRQLLEPTGLSRMMENAAVTGVTSNPTIFAKAIVGSPDYDEAIGAMVERSASTPEIYTGLVTEDIQRAADILRPVWEATGGADGFVSVEVSPELAHDADTTIAEAREWRKRVDRRNLLVKVPATVEGILAIRALIGEGISVNVTLIFSLDRYLDVAEAYLGGLEDFDRSGGHLSTVSSVASFFVSRIDTEVDERLERIGTQEALALRGKAAVANARVAYGMFLEKFSGSRWESLAARGGRLQRPLWASTSTKNPTYPDTLYIDTLLAPNTVNTVPVVTIKAYQDHGNPEPRLFDSEDIKDARATLDRLSQQGIDHEDVATVLEGEGIEKFIASYRELLDNIESKRAALS